ncbi:MAG TPA: hypothetical protein VFI52_01285 [Gemmatimonadaceae bacterium]|nr:hypothetical protein [Gemmatimonadaceae bacterium]
MSNAPVVVLQDEPLAEESLLLRLTVVLLRRRRLISRAAFAVGAIAAAATLLQSRSYTSTSTFMPQGGNSRSSLAGLAAQFGVAVPAGGEVAQTPGFYADLLRSHGVLQQVAQSAYEVPQGAKGVRRTLADVLELRGDSLTRLERAVDLLRASLRTSISASGVVRLDVRARQPALAQQLNARLLDALTQFNLERRQSQAAAERRFAERRLAEIGDSLHVAENALASFHLQNRGLSGSPLLRLQEDRLQRNVSMQQSIYTTVAQSYEQSKMEEVRDTPVLTIIEPAAMPVRPDSRGTVLRTLLGLILGAVAGAALALWLESLNQLSTREAHVYDELVDLRGALFRDLRRPWRLLGRSTPTSAAP